MLNITLTLTASPELLTTLNALLNSFGKPAVLETPDPVSEAVEVEAVEAVEVKAVEAEAPIKATRKTKKPEEAKDPAALVELTLEHLRERTGTKAKEGKREEIKKLLGDFGASSVFALAPEHYSEYLSQLVAL